MGEKWEYTSTTQIDSREPKKRKKKKVMGSQTRLLELALAISLIILIFFFFSINYFSILMQKMPNVESCSVMNRDSN